jgi:hypothetical protein
MKQSNHRNASPRACARPRPSALSVVVAAVLVAACAFLPMPAWAQLVPANLRAAIFLRALGYERSFASQSGSAKLVVVKGASGEASEDGAAMARAFQEILRASHLSRPVSITQVTHRDVASTAAALEAQHPDVIYLPRGTYDVSERLGAQRGLIVLCASAQAMERACSVSVEVSGSSPRLVVNLGHANRAGLRFDARLLGLSRVIR